MIYDNIIYSFNGFSMNLNPMLPQTYNCNLLVMYIASPPSLLYPFPRMSPSDFRACYSDRNKRQRCDCELSNRHNKLDIKRDRHCPVYVTSNRFKSL